MEARRYDEDEGEDGKNGRYLRVVTPSFGGDGRGVGSGRGCVIMTNAGPGPLRNELRARWKCLQAWENYEV